MVPSLFWSIRPNDLESDLDTREWWRGGLRSVVIDFHLAQLVGLACQLELVVEGVVVAAAEGRFPGIDGSEDGV